MSSPASALTDTRHITWSDDLVTVARSIVGSEWGKDNEIEDYTEANLRRYVSDPRNLLFVAYVGETAAGIVAATIIQHPTGKDWLYVDEVHVKSEFRRRGVGRTMMHEVIEFARKMRAEEVWLVTEVDNLPANKLYASLRPKKSERLIGYTYKQE